MTKTTKAEYVPVRMEPEMKARLQAAADLEGVTISEMVRRLIASIPMSGAIVGDGKVIWKEE